MAPPATHQPAPSDTQGNVSRQLAVVMVFGRRVAPALWRLTFVPLTYWVSLIVGGSGLAVGARLRIWLALLGCALFGLNLSNYCV
jgi:hypothetical protein